MSPPAAAPASRWRRNRVLYLLIAVAVAPILASYFAYYVAPPSGRSNYGTLVEPQRPVPAFSATSLDGTAFDLRSLKGKWIFVMADGGACDEYCQSKLFHMARLGTGRVCERKLTKARIHTYRAEIAARAPTTPTSQPTASAPAKTARRCAGSGSGRENLAP